MKLNRHNTVTCALTLAEAALFEEWATAMNYNANRGIKVAIRHAAEQIKPVVPADLEEV